MALEDYIILWYLLSFIKMKSMSNPSLFVNFPLCSRGKSQKEEEITGLEIHEHERIMTMLFLGHLHLLL